MKKSDVTVGTVYYVSQKPHGSTWSVRSWGQPAKALRYVKRGGQVPSDVSGVPRRGYRASDDFHVTTKSGWICQLVENDLVPIRGRWGAGDKIFIESRGILEPIKYAEERARKDQAQKGAVEQERERWQSTLTLLKRYHEASGSRSIWAGLDFGVSTVDGVEKVDVQFVIRRAWSVKDKGSAGDLVREIGNRAPYTPVEARYNVERLKVIDLITAGMGKEDLIGRPSDAYSAKVYEDLQCLRESEYRIREPGQEDLDAALEECIRKL